MVANPIGYPTGNPMPNPTQTRSGFDRPTPYPIPDPDFRVISPSLFLINHPFPKRHLSDAPIPERWGWGC